MEDALDRTGARRRGFLSRLARSPLLHFLLIGAAVAVLHGSLRERGAGSPDDTIRVSAAEVSRMAAAWQARWNRPPTPDELDGLVRSQVREIALYREALAMGLDEGDPVVRRVLGQKLEGIARDLVEMGLSPSDLELAEYFAKHGERYRPPPLISFTQVFLDPDARGDRTLDDAAQILAELQAQGDPASAADRLGDSFMLQSYYPEKTEQRIAGLFGSGFASSIFKLAPGRWHGPVLSGYGTHLVYVHALQEFPPPDLAEVQDLVTQDWIDDRREEITGEYFDDILAKYEVIIEREDAPPGTAAAAKP